MAKTVERTIRTTVSVRLLDEVLAVARQAAVQDGRSLSNWLERLIQRNTVGSVPETALNSHDFKPSQGNVLKCECGVRRGEHS